MERANIHEITRFDASPGFATKMACPGLNQRPVRGLLRRIYGGKTAGVRDYNFPVPSGLYFDRASRRGCHHRDPGCDSSSDTAESQRAWSSGPLPEQPPPIGGG